MMRNFLVDLLFGRVLYFTSGIWHLGYIAVLKQRNKKETIGIGDRSTLSFLSVHMVVFPVLRFTSWRAFFFMVVINRTLRTC